MTNKVMDYLYEVAEENNIGVAETDELKNSTPANSITEYRSIVLNTNWHNKDQLAFQFAHELGHVLKDSKSDKIMYFTPLKRDSERNANKYAIDLLLPIYRREQDTDEINVIRFMDCFSIPSHLEDLVIQEIEKF